MLKTLQSPVLVVWIYRKAQWVVLFSTDLTLSVAEIIEYYGARWKIEVCFKELKQDMGSAATQTRNPVAATNHLDFRMMATSLALITPAAWKKLQGGGMQSMVAAILPSRIFEGWLQKQPWRTILQNFARHLVNRQLIPS